MAVNNLRRVINLTKDLDANGDIQDSSLADGVLALPTPKITSVHPTANLSLGDLVYVVGSGFDQGANVLLISNTGAESVGGNVTFNSTSNVTFTWPLFTTSSDENPHDIVLEISNGTANTNYNSLSSEVLNSPIRGAVSGYAMGGYVNPASTSTQNTIQKFAFATDSNATDVSDLTTTKANGSSSSSTVSGYHAGGVSSPGVATNVIDKFSFASGSNATDVGDTSYVGSEGPGGTMSDSHGYSTGGSFQAAVSQIIKYSFITDENATLVGTGAHGRQAAGCMSETNGYHVGGQNNVAYDEYPFATDSNATQVGTLIATAFGNYGVNAGSSSETHGYVAGSDLNVNVIQKFPFATPSNNASDVGDLTAGKGFGAGTGSTSGSGYMLGGQGGSPYPFNNVIEKYPFASDNNGTDVADLLAILSAPSGAQI